MSHIFDDRVLEDIASFAGGTGAYGVGSAVSGFRTAASAKRSDGSAIQVNDTAWLYVESIDANGNSVADGSGNRYEEGLATYSAANQWTMTTTFRSSNSDAKVNWAASARLRIGITLIGLRTAQLDNELAMPLPAVPAAPTAAMADFLKFYARKIAGRMLPKYIGPSGVDQFIQDKLSTNANALYLPNTGTTVGLNLGIGWTTGGTVSHPTPSSTAPAIYNQQKRTRWANVATTTNQTLGLHTATAQKAFWRGNAAGLGGFFFHCRFAIGLWPAATVRLFVGLSDQNTSPVASDTLAGNCCGLWHDTTEAASVLNFVTRNGTTATKAAITLAANLAAGQCFDFYMYSSPNGSDIKYRLDEINTGTNRVDTSTTTTIPLNTAFMGPTLQMSNGTANTTVTTTAMEVMAFSCQSDN
jgi:hypothetical protein